METGNRQGFVLFFYLNESNGNLAYRVQEGNAHDGNAALQYIYNGLIWLWAEGGIEIRLL